MPVVEEIGERVRPGGAALAAALAVGHSEDVVLVTALGEDDPGRRVAAFLERAGVRLVDLGLAGATPEKVRVRADARLLLRLDHGPRRAAPVGPLTATARAALRSARAILVADYGRGVARRPDVRSELVDLAPAKPIVWDPHPHGARPLPRSRLVTPSRSEAAAFVPDVHGDELEPTARRARILLERWQADAVAITLGAR